jgi:hypothetical protein
MIEGLKVTVTGAVLRDIAIARVEHLTGRHEEYAKQVASMEAAKVEGMAYTNGDPVKALRDRMAQHRTEAEELSFIAKYLDLGESYLLDRTDLYRLGIVKDRY